MLLKDLKMITTIIYLSISESIKAEYLVDFLRLLSHTPSSTS